MTTKRKKMKSNNLRILFFRIKIYFSKEYVRDYKKVTTFGHILKYIMNG